eukprot:TRINITY_DN4992_c0_g1_i3.p1 TRINITY_DN4992_c0_g1~~TRINITY_DN4992_c0_g1_i3.p1  ORF type:complete len:342 (+),score=68.23 TRINITY_DN4992_c0_g1_i3:158-1183(+)
MRPAPAVSETPAPSTPQPQQPPLAGAAPQYVAAAPLSPPPQQHAVPPVQAAPQQTAPAAAEPPRPEPPRVEPPVSEPLGEAERGRDAYPGSTDEGLLSRLVPPPRDPIIYETGKMWSQIGQDKWVDKVLHQLHKGLVVESGANNGRSHSNSFFFEASRGWECLLVEANPHLQPVILDLKRNCHLFKGGLSLKWQPSTFKFDLAGPLGGIVDTLSNSQKARIRSEIGHHKHWMNGDQGSGKIVDVMCYPLHTILLAMGKKVVDYWSLDTEGSEQGILEHTDFTKITVGVMTIEHGNEGNRRSGILRAMRDAGFKRVAATGQDDYFANPTYFKMKGLPMPKEV